MILWITEDNKKRSDVKVTPHILEQPGWQLQKTVSGCFLTLYEKQLKITYDSLANLSL